MKRVQLSEGDQNLEASRMALGAGRWYHWKQISIGGLKEWGRLIQSGQHSGSLSPQ